MYMILFLRKRLRVITLIYVFFKYIFFIKNVVTPVTV